MALRASWIATWVIAYMRDSLSGLSTGAMQAASAAFPAYAFHAVTAFGLAWRLALAGAAINAAVVSEIAKRRTVGTAASNRMRLAGGRGGRALRGRDDAELTRTWARARLGSHVSGTEPHDCAADRPHLGR